MAVEEGDQHICQLRSEARPGGSREEIGVAALELGRQPGNRVSAQAHAEPPVPDHRMGVGEYIVGIREPDASGVDDRELGIKGPSVALCALVDVDPMTWGGLVKHPVDSTRLIQI